MARSIEGKPEHEYTSAAMELWQRAIVQPGAVQGVLFECHYVHYKAGRQKRTMKVLLDYKPFQGYVYKGVITAFWESGYRRC